MRILQRKKRNIFRSAKDTLLESPWSGRTIAICCLILIVFKQWVVHYVYGYELAGNTKIGTVFHYLGVLSSDFMVFAIVLFFVFLNLLYATRRLKILTNIINSTILTLFLVDIVTIYYFQSRLSLIDVYGYFTLENGSYFLWSVVSVTTVFFAGVLLTFFLVQRYVHWTKRKSRQMVFAVRFFMCSMLFSGIAYISSTTPDLQQNIIFLNMQSVLDLIQGNKDFSAIASIPLAKSYQQYFSPIQGKKKKYNVILVFAESFSMVDSKRDGGLYDNFPFFDKIQADGITFTNFIANGCTSETSHIALLQGVEPWQNPLETTKQTYDTYINYTDTLPEFFNKLGYQTTFLSTVTLDFLNEREFIQKMNFQNIIGEENFKNDKKYVFNAAPDHVLYNKALQIVASGDKDKPLFLAMQTVSSHKPYDTPLGKSKDKMFKYVDRNMYAFYQKLKQIGFFDEGILIIVGDHRKMEAINTAEFKKYGMSSHSRAVMTVVGKDIHSGQMDSGIIQHMDIFYSLKYLFGSGKVLVWKQFNNIFNPLQENRDRGVRYCRFAEKYYAIIKKDGDAYTLRPGMDPEIQNYITAFKKYQYQYLIGTGYDKTYFDNYRLGSGLRNELTIIAHRGDPGKTTDNSLKGFELAKENSANGIEFDTTITKDGVTVVYHGPSLNTTKCGKNKNIYTYTFAELQEKCPLSNGEKIQSLEGMLKQIQGWFDYYFIEIKVFDPKKSEQQALDVINTVNKLGMQGKVILTSYDKQVNYIIGGYKGIVAGRDTLTTENSNLVGKFPHAYFLIDKNIVTEEIVKTMEMLNKKLVVYTVNTQEDFDTLYDMGVRIMMTDDVPLVQKLAKKHLTQVQNK